MSIYSSLYHPQRPQAKELGDSNSGHRLSLSNLGLICKSHHVAFWGSSELRLGTCPSGLKSAIVLKGVGWLRPVVAFLAHLCGC